MAIDYGQTAKELIVALGGNENINNVTHCATRLRFILNDHSHVNKETVGKYVENVAKAEGCKLAVKSFVRFETGEGLEKKEEDFAAEVAAQMK